MAINTSLILVLSDSDVLLPSLDTLACMRHELAFMLEKIHGQVLQVCELKRYYAKLVKEFPKLLDVLFEVREIIRQCEAEVSLLRL